MVMPQQIKEILSHYVSGSKFMKMGKCQGGVVMLEKLNKDSKLHCYYWSKFKSLFSPLKTKFKKINFAVITSFTNYNVDTHKISASYLNI